MNPVLDASVLVAAISPQERHHVQARALFESIQEDTPYFVPALFRVEVIAAFARRGETPAFLDAVDALVRGPRFHSFPVDETLLELAVHVGRHARLRAYDSVYCALALLQSAPIFTLDAEIRAGLADVYPDLEVRNYAS